MAQFKMTEPIAPPLERGSLVNELQAELNNARVCGRIYLTECSAGDGGAGSIEFRLVQNVEKLGAEFRLRPFTP